ncbi:MAG: hypothetical protein ACI89W_000477 [Gammaproteobacteria bacterium]|jgi:hypothetical protein
MRTVNIAAVASDPNGEAITFVWRQLDGPIGTLSNANSATLNFTAPTVDEQQIATLEVTVEDPQGNKDTARVTVTVNNNVAPTPAPPAAVNNSSGGGSMGGLVLLLIPIVVIRRLTSLQLGQLHGSSSRCYLADKIAYKDSHCRGSFFA